MHRVHRELLPVSQEVANAVTKHLAALLESYGVSRANDLPEEGKIKLLRAARAIKDELLPDGLKPVHPRSLWGRLRFRLMKLVHWHAD